MEDLETLRLLSKVTLPTILPTAPTAAMHPRRRTRPRPPARPCPDQPAASRLGYGSTARQLHAPVPSPLPTCPCLLLSSPPSPPSLPHPPTPSLLSLPSFPIATGLQVLPDQAGGVTEEAVQGKMFELVFAFDEVRTTNLPLLPTPITYLYHLPLSLSLVSNYISPTLVPSPSSSPCPLGPTSHSHLACMP